MRLRLLAVLLPCALLAGACGGEGSSNAFTPAAPDPLVAGAADVLVERWGDREAFYAVMASLDAGYLAEQIISNPGDVRADGSIAGVAPAGPPLGLLSPVGPDGEGPPQALGARAVPVAVGPVQPQDLYVADVAAWLSEIDAVAEDVIAGRGTPTARETDPGRFTESVAHMVLELAGRGYTADQILEAILSGGVAAWTEGRHACLFIIGAGEPVVPDGEAAAGVRSDCPPLDALDDPGVTTTGAAGADTTSTTAGGGAPGGGDGVLTGRFEPVDDLSGIVIVGTLTNDVQVDLGGDVPHVILTVEFQFAPGPNDRDPDVTCQPVFVMDADADLAGASFGGTTWTGTLAIEAGTFSGTCSAGSQSDEFEAADVPFTLDLGSGRGTVDLGPGATLAFTVG